MVKNATEHFLGKQKSKETNMWKVLVEKIDSKRAQMHSAYVPKEKTTSFSSDIWWHWQCTNIDSIQQLSTMIWFSSDSFKFRTNFKCFTLSKLSACFLFCLRRHIYDVQFASRASARLRSFSVLSFLLPIWLSLSFRIAIFTTFTWKCCFKLVVVQHIFAPILLCPGNFANENSKSKSMDEWILWYSKFEWCVRACAYFVSFNFRYGSFACVFIYSFSLWWPERNGECPPTCFEGNSISII